MRENSENLLSFFENLLNSEFVQMFETLVNKLDFSLFGHNQTSFSLSKIKKSYVEYLSKRYYW